jgi:hypothetical protein
MGRHFSVLRCHPDILLEEFMKVVIKKNIHDGRSSGIDSNQARPGYKIDVSLLHVTCSVDILVCDRRPKTIKPFSKFYIHTQNIWRC